MRRVFAIVRTFLSDLAWAVWSSFRDNIARWKPFGMGAVLSVVLTGALADFRSVDLDAEGENGVKAAQAAIGAGLLLVIAWLPGRLTRQQEMFLYIASGVCVCLSGVFWLLSLMEGSIRTLLFIAGPFIVFGVLLMVMWLIIASVAGFGQAFRARRSLKQKTGNKDIDRPEHGSGNGPSDECSPLG